MDVTLKKATLNDANVISNIYALSWKSAYKGIVPQKYLDELKLDFWVSSFENRIKNNLITAQIIYENALPVGCVAYGKARDDKFTDWGEIISIYLLPDYFRKGYGQKLLQTAIIDMKIEGYKNFYLWVLKENINARNFYESNGFICNDDECTCQIMQKQLVDVLYILTSDKHTELK
ncbi:GCN5 family acetyltransferase [Clostridium carboxidivorans P7]|uniref:GCN5-related N-acetyltransferase n=1 Tax=Clostridium carboxidivorans P7 TaxID=536227 RepID=C6PPB7_9CLOT|nr:GNAT family N-acetyltransferase [Clostridium carboxidivorans]AKN29918.1 GCN5 family acetyltransferase [Clostridium carboxidivorans P7]EET88995.1 GCN5-related N-acetyltransferase [Clostridium carboxidivorans P7]